MQLPRKYHNRVLYALERTKALRSGEIDADPRWLQCIDRVLADVPDEGMRASWMSMRTDVMVAFTGTSIWSPCSSERSSAVRS